MSVTGGAAATVAVIAARQRQELLESFRSKGAFSAATALRLGDLELGGNPMLRMLIREGSVVETGDGRYYLDQEVAAQREYRRRMLVTGLTGILLALLLVFWFIS